MPLLVTIHLHNIHDADLEAFASLFDGAHRTEVSAISGFKGMDRYALTEEQVMPDIAQPWRFVTVYEFETDALLAHIAALAAQIDTLRQSGFIDDHGENERVLTYDMYSDWGFSSNFQAERPFSGLSVLLGNFSPGLEAEYQDWYDMIHAPEVTKTPGKVAMKRGKLAHLQIQPQRFTYGGELVLCAQQTDNLALTVKDFSERARGCSPSGIAFEPRSKAGSFARTIHYFSKVSGTEFWGNGIAYDGDISVYEAIPIS